jgi:uncharacterized protein
MAGDFLGAGPPFPFAPTPTGSIPLVADARKIEQGIRLVLETAPGERVMRPEFGCGIHDLLFQADTAALRGLVRRHVTDALVRWEPRIDVLDVQVEAAEQAPEVLLVRIDYRLRANNAVHNLVYPFFRTEGLRAVP